MCENHRILAKTSGLNKRMERFEVVTVVAVRGQWEGTAVAETAPSEKKMSEELPLREQWGRRNGGATVW